LQTLHNDMAVWLEEYKTSKIINGSKTILVGMRLLKKPQDRHLSLW